MENIEDERRGNYNDCKRETLATWLNKKDNVEEKGGPSWEQLVGALNYIGEHPLASDVEERYLRKRSHGEDTYQSSSKRRY